MKSLQLCWCSIFAFPLLALAGGNTALVEIDEVSDIKVEDKRITIQGSAVIKRRIMSTAEKGDSTVFGQPAQWFHAKVENAVFEVVPYFTPGIKGVPTGGHTDEELQRLSADWWAATHANAKNVKKGDAVSISYQGDQTTINGVRVTRIVGYGGVQVKEDRTR